MAWDRDPDVRSSGANIGIVSALAAGATQLIVQWEGDNRDIYAIGAGDKTWAFLLQIWDGTNWTTVKVITSSTTGTHGDATYQNVAELSQFVPNRARLYVKNTHATDALTVRLNVNPMERLDVA